MATKLVVFAAGLVLVLAALPAPAQEPVITSQSEVTIVGCVEREQAYRTRIHMGSSSTVTTDDLVLSEATPVAGSGTPVEMSGVFSLTGTLESQLLNDVGRRVQIVGFMEDMAAHTTPQNTAITTLRRLFVKVWQPAGACS
jgi:hypothetical protein